jgi:hypothetical protein
VHGPEWFHRVELDRSPADFGRIAPLTADQTMRALPGTVRHEVASGARTGRLYGESLSLALMSYVVDRIPASCLRLRGALSEAQGRRLQLFGRVTRPAARASACCARRGMPW